MRPGMDGQGNITMAGTGPVPIRSPAAAASISASQSPAPVSSAAYPSASAPGQVYPPAFQRRPSSFAPQTPTVPSYQAAPPTVPSTYGSYQANRVPAVPPAAAAAAAYNPNAPRSIEVFHLSDPANATIPADIREQFHCDDKGRVLFFSAPPRETPTLSSSKKLGHSLKYLAAKEERRSKIERKRSHQDVTADNNDNDNNDTTNTPAAKQARVTPEISMDETDTTALAARVERLTTRAVEMMAGNIASGTDSIYEALYGEQASAVRDADARAREEQARVDRETCARTTEIKTGGLDGGVNLRGKAVYMDE